MILKGKEEKTAQAYPRIFVKKRQKQEIGLTGFEPATFAPPVQRASQTAPQPAMNEF